VTTPRATAFVMLFFSWLIAVFAVHRPERWLRRLAAVLLIAALPLVVVAGHHDLWSYAPNTSTHIIAAMALAAACVAALVAWKGGSKRLCCFAMGSCAVAIAGLIVATGLELRHQHLSHLATGFRMSATLIDVAARESMMFVATVFLLVAPAATLAHAHCARRMPRPPAFAWPMAIAPLSVGALAVCLFANQPLVAVPQGTNFQAAIDRRIFDLLAQLRYLAGLIALLVIIAAAFKRNLRMRWPRFAALVVLFCLAGVLFAATRSHAHDAALMPTTKHDWTLLHGHAPIPLRLPEIRESCLRAKDAPIVVFDAKNARVTMGEAVFESPNALHEAMAKKRQLWLQFNPGRRFPGRVMIDATANTPFDTMRPWLQMLRRTGFDTLLARYRRSYPSLETKTLGAVERYERCAVTISPNAAAPSWGRLLRQELAG